MKVYHVCTLSLKPVNILLFSDKVLWMVPDVCKKVAINDFVLSPYKRTKCVKECEWSALINKGTYIFSFIGDHSPILWSVYVSQTTLVSSKD